MSIIWNLPQHKIKYNSYFTGYPRIQPFMFPEKLTEGQKAKLLCSVLDGLGPFKFHWYKNDQPLLSSPHIMIQNHDDYSGLFINSLGIDDAGNYSCTVISSLGRDSYSSQLVINGKWNNAHLYFISDTILNLLIFLLVKFKIKICKWV